MDFFPQNIQYFKLLFQVPSIYGNTSHLEFRKKRNRQGDARAALEVAQEIRRLAKDLGKSSKEVPLSLGI